MTQCQRHLPLETEDRGHQNPRRAEGLFSVVLVSAAVAAAVAAAGVALLVPLDSHSLPAVAWAVDPDRSLLAAEVTVICYLHAGRSFDCNGSVSVYSVSCRTAEQRVRLVTVSDQQANLAVAVCLSRSVCSV